MLSELSIKNFAIIDQLSVTFEKGLTVLTGETGAGKSIIIDAIGLLVGGRGSTDFVRHGEKKAEIEGLFFIEDKKHPVYKKASNIGVEIDEDGMVVLQRAINTQGKSICRINGKLVTLAILREIGGTIVDIHGQHEHQHLMQQDRHLSMLDQFAEETLKSTLIEYNNLYTSYKKIQRQVLQYTEDEQKLAQRLDLLQYQLKEIEKANLKPDEDQLLNEERVRLSNSERLYKTVYDSYHALYGEGKGLEWLMLAMNNIEEITAIDKSLGDISESISNCYYLLEESAFSLRDYYEGIEFDPNRLEFIEERLNEISQLKRKYGNDVTEILEYASKIEEEIELLQNKDENIHQMQQQLESVVLDLYVEANHLTKLRMEVAKGLTEKIQQQLKDLYMDKTKFEINITERVTTNKDPIIEGKRVSFVEDGIDKIEFLISTNPGEPVKPLAKIASGGEISRIMLALKSIFSIKHGVTSLIFDEVDTGVSGRVAQAIAEKIHAISSNSQVLCITHLPQVAAMADTHLYITKDQTEQKTSTNISTLTKADQVEEIARMIAGVEVTELTRQHAKELLNQAIDKKHT